MALHLCALKTPCKLSSLTDPQHPSHSKMQIRMHRILGYAVRFAGAQLTSYNPSRQGIYTNVACILDCSYTHFQHCQTTHRREHPLKDFADTDVNLGAHALPQLNWVVVRKGDLEAALVTDACAHQMLEEWRVEDKVELY
eukprot:1157850-Pelagomonas_calceolata.AAC.18